MKNLNRLFSLFLLFSTPFSTKAITNDQDTIFSEASRTFVVAPLIINNPAMKTGFGALSMYFFRINQDDDTSPPSVVSLMGLYSTNSSYFFAPSARLFWNEDKNRATVTSGTLRVNNDFEYDLDDDPVNLVFSELRYFLVCEYSRKIIGDFYAGILYSGIKTNYRFDQGTIEENNFARNFFQQNDIDDNFISSFGFNLSYDSRNYPYYPTKGISASIRPKFFTEWLGSNNNYTDTDYDFRLYFPTGNNQLIAVNVAGGFATGDVPFDGYQTYGVRNKLRGYQAGKYKGKHMIAGQVEYRTQLYKRWGAVAFAGSGRIWGHDTNEEEQEAFERNCLPSAGAGIRFLLSKKKHINLRLDYAWGVDGNQGIYFGVMEAF
ncbi:hypothetical protein DMA11_05720 [Marinilabiliaceae bacterium JC017]|nr:hypothetical protein DMA11_05720 [Marinilabiliaceae bacterium JC017]